MTPIALSGKIPKNIEKMLMLITYAEGTDKQSTPYNELFGYENFIDFSKHPQKVIVKNGYPSSAAGRYQIIYKTYKWLGMTDMQPVSQDLAAIKLLKICRAYDYALKGDFDNAILKASSIWASLPGSTYGQPMRSLEQCKKFLATLKISSYGSIVPILILVALALKRFL